MAKSKIRFIVDECVDFSVVLYLRNKNYDVTSVAEDYLSLDDTNILTIAFKENRVLLTDDKDFGHLIFKYKLRSSGLILFRLADQSSKAKIDSLERLINNYEDKLIGNFTVISKNKIRIRKI